MKLVIERARFPGVLLIKPERFLDGRGSGSELYKASELRRAGIRETFVQENRSISRKGVLRGLHYQRAPYAQAKLVRCGRGRVFNAAVDLRRGSKTFGVSFCLTLSEAEGTMVYLPAGFAHGFLALTDGAEVLYKCSREFSAAHYGGLRWNDPQLGIKWPAKKPLLSAKDGALPLLKEIKGI
ncbi:MAG TPA: dTDP-4-dehydrorhamnose 3,5-epimerase [Elusimicrobia bacterium]|nr:MAG: dTDP-4-dehydrorhamnose 3,5-epimerase [Elusimicrobia bacterium GWF2_62_30]HBA61054.1 dTDP-4-dehydrorhamnose 3,5-epimerase [Elusimicrobiota bacterium]